jgi:cobalt-zinc-cadmium efflux system outer membrane protein
MPDLDVTVSRDRELDKASNGFALGLRVPLWNANRGQVARSEASLKIAAAEADRKRLDLRAELEERVKNLDVAGAQVRALDREILPSAGESLRLARRSYEEGETSLLDLLDAQRTLRDTQREAVESRLALALAVADIQRLVGPDFDPWRQVP